MERATTVVIGAGHAGLAASHFLTGHSIDHVVLERGEVANSWRTERWDSLRLLTPNWQSRLPGLGYAGQDPDGYMTAAEVTELIERFARSCRAPVRTSTTVPSAPMRMSRSPQNGGFQRSTGGSPLAGPAALASAPVIASNPDCPAFAMVCLEPIRLDIKSGGSATRMLVVAGRDCTA